MNSKVSEGFLQEHEICRLIWAQVHTNDKRRIREGVKSADRLMQLGVDETRQLTYLAAVGEYKCAPSTSSVCATNDLWGAAPDTQSIQ